MDANEITLSLFTDRVRKLILRFNELKKENQDLYDMVGGLEARIKKLEEKVTQADADYASLKTARMLEISDGDMENAKKRLAKLIRDVNKCITLLSEK